MIYSHKMADFEGHFNLLWSHIISCGKQFRSFKSSLHVAQIQLQNGKHFHTAQSVKNGDMICDRVYSMSIVSIYEETKSSGGLTEASKSAFSRPFDVVLPVF